MARIVPQLSLQSRKVEYFETRLCCIDFNIGVTDVEDVVE